MTTPEITASFGAATIAESLVVSDPGVASVLFGVAAKLATKENDHIAAERYTQRKSEIAMWYALSKKGCNTSASTV